MTEYLTATFSTDNYDKFRPTYPQSFISHIVELHLRNLAGKTGGTSIPVGSICHDGRRPSISPTGHGGTVVDLGCGTGQVTFPLSERFSLVFERVVGVDPSAGMIKKCKELAQQRTRTGSDLEFVQGYAEDLSNVFGDQTVDLVTGAECFHWFRHEEAFKEIARILKPLGSLAFWFYLDPIIVSAKGSDGQEKTVDYDEYIAIYRKFLFEDDRYLGPYWEHPGGNIFRTHCKTILIPEALYKDIRSYWYYPKAGDLKKTDRDEKLVISRTWRLQDYRNNIKSFSTYHKFVEDHRAKGDLHDVENYIPDTFSKELKDKFGLSEDDELQIIWSSVQFYAVRR